MRREDLIREVMSMRGCGYQVAKRIVLLAALPEGSGRRINSGQPREYMGQAVAANIVAAARERIKLVDEGG